MRYAFHQQDIDAIVDLKYKEALLAVGNRQGMMVFVPLDKLKEVWAIYRPRKLKELPGGCCGGEQKIEATVPQMAKTVAQAGIDTIKHIVSGKGAICSQEEEDARMAICKKCQFYIPEKNRCQKCGCFLTLKLKLKAVSCPIRLWNAIG